MTAETGTATLYPLILYRDADAAIAWLESLGFEQKEIHRDDEGRVAHAELRLGGALLMLGTAGAGREPFRSLPAGGALVYCAVEDADGLHARAREAGADVAVELTDTDYGSRDFAVRDPEGNIWSFGTYRP